MDPARLFSIDEANGLVPRLEFLLQRVQQAARELREEAARHAEARGVPFGAVSTAELQRTHAPAREIIERLDGAVEEIQQLGVEVKDLEMGLCDFPARLDGQIVYLCWQTGEPEVAYWHGVDTGFSGRRPLPGVTRSVPLQ